MAPRWDNLSDPVFYHAAERPDQPAVIDGPTTLSYRQLAELVGKASVYLRDLGIGAGTTVGVSLTNRADHLVLLFAILRVGARLTEIAASAPLDYAVLGRLGIGRLFAEPNAASGTIPLTKIDTGWRDALTRFDGDHRHDDSGDAVATITLSSGSTGTPKGVAVTHRQFFARYEVHAEAFAATGALAFGQAPPFLLSTSLGNYVFFRHLICQTASGGATVLMPEYRHPMDVALEVRRWDDAVLVATSNMCRAFIACAPAEGMLLPRVRALISAGQPLFADEKRAVVARVTPHLYDSYGTAAIGGITCLGPNEMQDKAATVGRPVPGIELEIVDSRGARVADGSTGRLRCRGATAAQGLVGQVGTIDEGFVDGWYYPGEIASLDADGYVTIAGRSLELIRRGGVEFLPPELEAAIAAHPAVRDVAVVGRPKPDGTEEVVAFVVVQGELSRDDIMQHCASRLPRDRWPDRVTVLDAMPKLGNGKTDRTRLRSAAIRPAAQPRSNA